MSYRGPWKEVRLGEAGRWLSGGTPSTANSAYWGGDIPWISSGRLTEFRLSHSERQLTKLGVQNGTRVVPAGTILIVVRGMSLKTEVRIGIAQRELAFGQDCKALEAGDAFVPEFLAYAMVSKHSQLLSLVDEAGHGTGRLNSDQLFAVTVPCPERSEQRKIVDVLSALDNKIAAIEKVIATAERLMLALVATIDVRVPVSVLARQSTASVKPGDFDSVVAHFSLPAFDAGRRPEVAVGGSIKSSKFLISEPGVLFSKLNPRIPRIWNVSEVPPEMALASTEFVVLVPENVTSSALWSALAQPEISEMLRQMVAGTSGSHQRIRPNELLEMQVPDVRTLDDSSTALVESLGRVCHRNRQEILRLTCTRDELLPLLMSGKIRVKDAEARVAEVV